MHTSVTNFIVWVHFDDNRRTVVLYNPIHIFNVVLVLFDCTRLLRFLGPVTRSEYFIFSMQLYFVYEFWLQQLNLRFNLLINSMSSKHMTNFEHETLAKNKQKKINIHLSNI